MTKTVLITGLSGFVGRHMCNYLAALSDPPKIVGIDISGIGSTKCDCFYNFDLSSAKNVEDVIKQTKPHFIIHFAGRSNTEHYEGLFSANVLSIAALLESARRHVPDVVVVAVGSAAEYGWIKPEQLPITEQALCAPVTAYGLSKLLATQTALYYHRVHNICVMIVRPFQLIGKGAPSHLAPGAFAEQLKQALALGSTVIRVGNLESCRDFLDVHDAVEAIWALCNKPAPGQIFNLSSGKPTRMADLLHIMINHCGVDVKIEEDPARLRATSDVSISYGSFRKVNAHCGWGPKMSLHESISEMFK